MAAHVDLHTTGALGAASRLRSILLCYKHQQSKYLVTFYNELAQRVDSDKAL